MYNKIFTKILDSSIWLEPTTTRLVWLTFIAAMDEDGFVQFASIRNLAHRARVDEDEAESAVECLESPDLDSSDPDNDGRRIERVPGGWMILNAQKYRELVTRVIIKDQTRKRVAKHRERKRNADVTRGNEKLTPSDTDTDTEAEAEKSTPPSIPVSAIAEGGIASRIGAIFHRREGTKWAPNEIRALKQAGEIHEDDLSALERYYAAHWPPKRNENILRHGMLAFLNNFAVEIDRANAFIAEKEQPKSKFAWTKQ